LMLVWLAWLQQKAAAVLREHIMTALEEFNATKSLIELSIWMSFLCAFLDVTGYLNYTHFGCETQVAVITAIFTLASSTLPLLVVVCALVYFGCLNARGVS